MFMLTTTHTAAVKSLTADLEEARDEIAKLKGARRIDGITVADLETKFKLAITDLGNAEVEKRRLATGWDKCGDELNATKRERDALQKAVNKLNTEVDGLRSDVAAAEHAADANKIDAQKWRDRAEREAARGQSRKNAKPVAAKVKRGAGK